MFKVGDGVEVVGMRGVVDGVFPAFEFPVLVYISTLPKPWKSFYESDLKLVGDGGVC